MPTTMSRVCRRSTCIVLSNFPPRSVLRRSSPVRPTATNQTSRTPIGSIIWFTLLSGRHAKNDQGRLEEYVFFVRFSKNMITWTCRDSGIPFHIVDFSKFSFFCNFFISFADVSLVQVPFKGIDVIIVIFSAIGISQDCLRSQPYSTKCAPRSE